MKILESENQDFFKDLEFFLKKRLQQNIKDNYVYGIRK